MVDNCNFCALCFIRSEAERNQKRKTNWFSQILLPIIIKSVLRWHQLNIRWMKVFFFFFLFFRSECRSMIIKFQIKEYPLIGTENGLNDMILYFVGTFNSIFAIKNFITTQYRDSNHTFRSVRCNFIYPFRVATWMELFQFEYSVFIVQNLEFKINTNSMHICIWLIHSEYILDLWKSLTEITYFYYIIIRMQWKSFRKQYSMTIDNERGAVQQSSCSGRNA